MFLYWTLVVCTGLWGALADVVLGHWSESISLRWWLGAAGLYLVFMTGLGLVVRIGLRNGYPLTIAVMLVVMVNIAGLAGYDVLAGHPIKGWHFVGIVAALTAVASFELARQ